MAADDGSARGATWPLPKFTFVADLGDGLKNIPFSEVNGLDKEQPVIEYRKGNSKLFSTEKTSGTVRYSHITLKHGVFLKNDTFLNLYNKISTNAIARRTIIVKMIDETGAVAMTWQLNNAWPTKISNTNLNPDNKEVTVDSIEFAHEQISVIN